MPQCCPCRRISPIPDACTGAVAAAVERFGRLDALCNIAGIVRMAHTPEMPREHYLQTIAINLNAPWFLSQAAIPHLLETGGAIVNCASSAALIGEAYAAAYCASKAGLVNMTKAMAMEYARKPIRINAVAPGGMMTNISDGMTFPEDAEMDLIARYSGMRGLVEVDDVADLDHAARLARRAQSTMAPASRSTPASPRDELKWQGKIGFIGLGSQGGPMAHRIADAGMDADRLGAPARSCWRPTVAKGAQCRRQRRRTRQAVRPCRHLRGQRRRRFRDLPAADPGDAAGQPDRHPFDDPARKPSMRSKRSAMRAASA